jgi:PKD repeat protein
MRKALFVLAVIGLLAGGSVACSDSGGGPTGPSATNLKADFSLFTGNGLMVTMTDRSVAAVSKSINWGDKVVNSELTHIYAEPGEYTVTLTVTDSNGATATKTLSDQRVTMAVRSLGNLSNANPMPLPVGTPTGTCTLAAATENGKLRYNATMSPGGSSVQFYLLQDGTFAPGDVGCHSAPGDPSCPRGIGPQIITNSQQLVWDVTPAKYCIFVRNLSATAQNISGPVELEAPYFR